MVSLRNGKTAQPDHNEAAKTSNPNPPPRNKATVRDAQRPTSSEGKKRKAESPPPEEDKKELSPPSTPKGRASEPQTEPKEHEKTPGRVGPIKRDDFSVKPDIKPFKGPPGKKVRKTAYEKDQEYTQFSRENEGHCFHELHVCFDKGPNGSPTYDKQGFELDYHKVADWMRPQPYNKSAVVNGMERTLEKRSRDAKRMAEIFFEKGEAPSDTDHTMADDYWKDRVSKDLNVPWHRIDVSHFEEWEKRGFKKARKGEYQNFSEAERARMLGLLSGASLRK